MVQLTGVNAKPYPKCQPIKGTLRAVSDPNVIKTGKAIFIKIKPFSRCFLPKKRD